MTSTFPGSLHCVDSRHRPSHPPLQGSEMLKDYLSSEKSVQEELLSGKDGIKRAVKERQRRIQEQLAQTKRTMAKDDQ